MGIIFYKIRTVNEARMFLTQANIKIDSYGTSPKPISAGLEATLTGIVTPFTNHLSTNEQDAMYQGIKVREKNTNLVVLHLLVKHFIIDLNNNIERSPYPYAGGFSKQDREVFHLGLEQTTLPSLRTEGEILLWAENIISGETIRITNGKPPITSPPLSSVQQYYTIVTTKKTELMPLKANTKASQRLVSADVETIKEAYMLLRDELNFYYRNLNDSARRDELKQWGIVFKSDVDEKEYVSGFITTDGAPLENATVKFMNSNITLKSDKQGFFSSHQLPPGKQDVKITCDGFIEQIITQYEVKPNVDNTLNVELELKFS